MAGSTLHRFQIDLSDVDRGIYENLDFRIALHPSETLVFMVLRVLAYAINYQPGIEFSPGGISDTDEPAIRVPEEGSAAGATKLWIEIGKPSGRKLHKAAKAAREVKVYTHRDPELVREELTREKVHRADQIEVYSISPAFLESLAERVKRGNEWTVLSQDGTLTVGIGEDSRTANVKRHFL